MSNFEFSGAATRWRWAGLVVIDDEGNLATWQVDRPHGMVTVSQEIRGSGWTSMYAVTTIKLTLEGDATEWDQGRDVAPGDHTPRTLGLIGHPDSGKTALGNIIKGLNERPMLPPGERGH